MASVPINVVMRVEGRHKRLSLPRGNCESLREEFKHMCDKDPVLKTRMDTHYPTFHSYHEKYGIDLELEPSDRIKNDQLIKVHFASYIPTDADEEQNKSLQGSEGSCVPDEEFSSSTVPITQKQRDNALLNLMGVHVTKQTAANTCSERGKQKPLRPTVVQPQSSPESDYFRMAEKRRQENAEMLRAMNIVPPEKVPRLRRKRTGPKHAKENDAPKRNMPSRAVKANKNVLQPTAAPNDEVSFSSINFGEGTLSDDEEDAGPTTRSNHDNNSGNMSNLKRRKPQKKRRAIGQRITKHTPLPPFPPELHSLWSKGMYNTNKTNAFLKHHIFSITGDYYPTKHEYLVLKCQMERRLMSYGIEEAAAKLMATKIKCSLNASLRGCRSYQLNVKPRLQEVKQKEKEIPIKITETSATQQQVDPEFTLRQPVTNKMTTKLALETSTSRVRYITTHGVKQSMQLYPYLSDEELLIHDYCTRVPLQRRKIEERFERAIRPLGIIFEGTTGARSELEKMKLFKNVEEYINSDDEVWPCIQFWDEKNKNAEPLNSIPVGQAPALVVTSNDKEMVSASLVFDREALITIKKPSAFVAMAILIAAYFVYHIEYPKPYENQMNIFERILHGGLRDALQKRQKAGPYLEFIEKFVAARDIA